MNSSWRVIILSVLGFALPVGLAVIGAPLLFDYVVGPADLSSSASSARIQMPEIMTGKGDEQLTIAEGSAFASVRSDSALEISPNLPFIVSALVRFDQLPTGEDRHVFIAKFAGKNPPYAGWAFAMHRLSTSLRPEIYWRGDDGQGGWFAFERVNLRTDQWYSFTAVLSKELSLSLYLQEAKMSPEALRLLSQASVLNEPTDPANNTLQFLGGYDVSGIPLPRTRADLNFGAIRADQKAFHGELSSLLIAAPQELPRSKRKLMAFLNGGSKKIHSQLKDEDVKLWISERGIDESGFARPTTLSGGAQWKKQLEKASPE